MITAPTAADNARLAAAHELAAGKSVARIGRKMEMKRDIWHLHRGNEIIAALEVCEVDFPWLHGRIKRYDGFAPLAHLFAELQQIVETLDTDEEIMRFDELVGEITGQTTLTDGDGRPVAEFLLHVDGDEARWRWSYEPFT